MIRVIDLHKTLGEFNLRGINLEIGANEYFVVLGPTGAGKTVLLECIAGVHRPDRGQVWLDGVNATRLPPEQRLVGYVPQEYALFPHLSVERNMAFGMRMRGAPRSECHATVHRFAEMLKIQHLLQRRPRTLSGGEQQRVALARALAIRPRVLLLDEPLSALDEKTRAELSDELADVPPQTGASVVHVCHDLGEAARLADRVAVINQGHVVQVGTTHEVFHRPASRFVAEFLGAQNILEATADASPADGIRAVSVGQCRFHAADTGVSGRVCATIRPEEIDVCPAGQARRGPNVLAGHLRKAEERGALIHLVVDVGVPLVALMSRQSHRLAGVQVGEDVCVTFPPSAVHLFASQADELTASEGGSPSDGAD
jgi:ABC-type Fe3+/spermidine/putrescine transport system ATPase subunit